MVCILLRIYITSAYTFLSAQTSYLHTILAKYASYLHTLSAAYASYLHTLSAAYASYLQPVLIDSIATAPPRTTDMCLYYDLSSEIRSSFLCSVSLLSMIMLSIFLSTTSTLNTWAVWNISVISSLVSFSIFT